MTDDREHIDERIAKVLAGEASREESALLEAWCQASEENRRYYEEAGMIFQRVESLGSALRVDSAGAWNRLNARIEAGENPPAPARVLPLFRRPGLWRMAASVALVTVLAILLTTLPGRENTSPVQLSSREQIVADTLPDGSRVTLNQHTELAYVLTKDQVREVRLRGEAFFEVEHDTLQPFEIKIGDVLIRDIGTAFHVSALPESQTIEVQVESGEVHFYTASDKGLRLLRGEKARYDKTTGRFSKLLPDPEANTLSYKSRVFRFKDTELREVIRQVNTVYDSQITLEDPRTGECRLSVMFNNESLDTLLDLIVETLDLEVERSEGKIVLKGRPCKDE